MNTIVRSAVPDAGATVRSYHFGGYEVEMEVNDTVFQPTLTSRLLAQAVKIPEGRACAGPGLRGGRAGDYRRAEGGLACPCRGRDGGGPAACGGERPAQRCR